MIEQLRTALTSKHVNTAAPLDINLLYKQVKEAPHHELFVYGLRLKLHVDKAEVTLAGSYCVKYTNKYQHDIKAYRASSKGGFLKTGDAVYSHTVDGALYLFKDKAHAEECLRNLQQIIIDQVKKVQSQGETYIDYLRVVQLP